MFINFKKKALKENVIAILVIVIILSISSNIVIWANEVSKNTNSDNVVSYKKVWKITLNEEVDVNNIEEYVYVVDSSGNKLKNIVKYGQNKNELLVQYPEGGYEFGQEYILVIRENLKSISGQVLGERTLKRFSIESVPKINNLYVSKDYIVDREEFKIIVNTDQSNKVQYYAEITNKSTGLRVPLMRLYTTEVYGDEEYVISCKNGLPKGEYILKLYVKRGNTKGVIDSDGVSYDHTKEILIKVNPAKQSDISNKVRLDGQGVSKLNEKYYVNTGSIVNINLIDSNISNVYAHVINDNNNIDNTRIDIVNGKATWAPTIAGDYRLEFTYSKDGKEMKDNVFVMVNNMEIRFVEYNMTIEEFVSQQIKESMPRVYENNSWVNANFYDVEYYLNPKNLMDNNGIYQFLILNYSEGMTVEEADNILAGKGILEGKGAAFLEGAEKYNINPAYLIAHALLETGNGASKLATGIEVSVIDGQEVEPKVTYNMYGIQAIDQDPNGRGSEYAYKQGWFTPESAIIEGAEWIGQGYINSEKYKQNTLYKMRWNKDVIWHQYASDVAWANKQVDRIKRYTDMSPGLKLIFEIPVFKGAVALE